MINANTQPVTNISDMYMSVLSTLSVDDKLVLISKLSASIKNDVRDDVVNGDLSTMFCGKWDDIGELRNVAYTGREVSLRWNVC